MRPKTPRGSSKRRCATVLACIHVRLPLHLSLSHANGVSAGQKMVVLNWTKDFGGGSNQREVTTRQEGIFLYSSSHWYYLTPSYRETKG